MQNKEFNELLYQVLMELKLPTIIEEVRQAEEDLKNNPIELPESLKNPKEVWERIQGERKRLKDFKVNYD